MKIFVLLALFLFQCAPAAMNAAMDKEKCFTYSGGGFDDEIRLTIDGNNVKGVLSVGRTNSEMPTRMYEFTGTLSKGEKSRNFADGKMPTAFERTGDKMTATLSGKDLSVKLSEGTQDVYTARFTPCG